MNADFLNRIQPMDCIQAIPCLAHESIDLLLSDIPYGIGLDTWDVLHENHNAGFLGSSPAQQGKPAFQRRGKPINGWSRADRDIGRQYQAWCLQWSEPLFDRLKPGASAFVFCARRSVHRVINAFEDSGFLLKDMLAWKKTLAHHRAQRLSTVLRRRGLQTQALEWEGWRLGNLAPIWEPILWFVKPYGIGGTVTDNVIAHGLGAMNTDAAQQNGRNPTNLLEFGFAPGEGGLHPAQKPLALMQHLVRLSTREGHVVLDPFMGSGTTALAARSLGRSYIGFEVDEICCGQASARLAQAMAGPATG